MNLPDIERHLALAPALARVRCELRDSAWKLPDAALQERLATLRQELETAVAGTSFESDVA